VDNVSQLNRKICLVFRGKEQRRQIIEKQGKKQQKIYEDFSYEGCMKQRKNASVAILTENRCRSKEKCVRFDLQRPFSLSLVALPIPRSYSHIESSRVSHIRSNNRVSVRERRTKYQVCNRSIHLPMPSLQTFPSNKSLPNLL